MYEAYALFSRRLFSLDILLFFHFKSSFHSSFWDLCSLYCWYLLHGIHVCIYLRNTAAKESLSLDYFHRLSFLFCTSVWLTYEFCFRSLIAIIRLLLCKMGDYTAYYWFHIFFETVVFVVLLKATIHLDRLCDIAVKHYA